MTGYASNTGTRRNLEALRRHGWRILVTPAKPRPPAGFSYAIDNGAWRAYCRQEPFEEAPFLKLVERFGAMADFVVAPDIVAGGLASLEFSLSWIPRLVGMCRRVLLPVQDGMHLREVAKVLAEYSTVGLFLGGSTAWKLDTMYSWGILACATRRHYHVGRVNTVRRIRLAAEAGADSFDGTSATMFSCNVPRLNAALLQGSLLVPSSRVP